VQGVWADYHHDGWPDLYVSSGRNYLYNNKHDGTFMKSVFFRVLLSADGREQGSMESVRGRRQ
jgi:hypothetical protein